ncbi:MAG: Na+/H+ antiporter NhaA [Bacteroidota bacterium]|nr:MAG: Na+/H+ antiporter NhaA [Bacteroidota bacterium]
MMSANKNNIADEFLNPFQRFFKIEASGGIVLLFFTLIALFWANSPWGESYFRFWEYKFTIGVVGQFSLTKEIILWINDGLMAIFFFVVGLEIKRELIAGELSSLKKASLPFAAALGGMILPAIFYLTVNNNPEANSGWGIPMATDIAFSLGILSLLGKRVPISLKIFLMAFAIIDDLGAIVIIALFYSEQVYWNYLLIGIALFALLVVFNRLKIKSIHPYMAVGWVIWYMFLKSGIHPTIAGVMIAFTIPVKRTIRLKDFSDNMQRYLNNFCQPHDQNSRITLNHEQLEAIDSMENDIFDVQSPVQRLEHALHRFVTYVVMPVFALANAGVVLHGASIQNIFTGLSGVIEISMVLGKVLGIFIFSWLAVKLGLAVLPEKVKWNNIIGIGFLGGMGFTMSLFISNLAFNSEVLLNPAKIGILVGSLIAGTIGYFLLKHTLRTNENE